MSTSKKLFLFVHRWFGFISGLVVFIVSITGCMFCFQDEIQDAVYSWRHVQPQAQQCLPPSVLMHNALHTRPKAIVSYTYYLGTDRPAQVFITLADKQFHIIYLNPYTGKILAERNPATDFFDIVKMIHLYLLLPTKVGQVVVGVSVLIFVVLLVTGIILWWPKRKVDRKRSFTIRWNGRWRRLNYDLHNVLGFYACLIALVLAITGLAMSFEWVLNGMYLVANGGKIYPQERIFPQSDSLNKVLPQTKLLPVDKAFNMAQRVSATSAAFLIFESPAVNGAISITAYKRALRYDHRDYYYFDKYTGKLLGTLPYAKESAGLKLNDMNYDIHVGQIAGLPGKIIAFIVSLISASLPVTGLLVWLGKRNKPKRGRFTNKTQQTTTSGEKVNFIPKRINKKVVQE